MQNACMLTNTSLSSGTFLRVLPVRVRSGGQEVDTYALLDTGSDVSLCTKDLVRSLGACGKMVNCSLNTINSKPGCTMQVEEVSLEIFSCNMSGSVHAPKVWAIDSIPVSPDHIPRNGDLTTWSHLRDLNFPVIDTRRVGVLIGADVPEAFWALEQRLGKRKEPYAVRTLLGWSLFGPKGPPCGHASRSNMLISNDTNFDAQLKALWRNDFHDLNVLDKPEMSKNDRHVVDVVNNAMQLVKGHYCVGFPWRRDSNDLKGNIAQARSRLQSLKHRLIKDNILLFRYCNEMNKYISEGHARLVSDAEREMEKLWFLPHHPVLNPAKPDKLRIVFDCAANFQGKSLNSYLFSGPDVTSLLLGVLLRFRKNPVALIGDIQSMFHQIRVAPPDCKKLCFLWWPEGQVSSKPRIYQMLVHLFGATSSPFIANHCLRKMALLCPEEYSATTLNCIQRSFYVDDCLVSVKNVEQAIVLRNELSSLLSRGGFHITKWISNSPEVLKTVPKNDLAPSLSQVDLNFNDLPIEKALGVKWDPKQDTLGFTLQIKSKPFTKRGILSIISSIYDPFGIAAPFTLKGKVILQKLTSQKQGWDSLLTGPDLEDWKSWIKDCTFVPRITLPRCFMSYNSHETVQIQLHLFCDASQVGYGVVSYLRLKDLKGNISCRFVLGKSRLSPLKIVTIPRLELTAAVLAVRMNGLLRRELDDVDVSETFYWTDSMTVLKYINNDDRRFHTFVANRLAVIENGSKKSQWRHISTKLNPADDASRGLKASELTADCRWLCGPRFLRLPQSEWPQTFCDLGPIETYDPEVKTYCKVVSCAVKPPLLVKMFERFSNWSRLVKAVAWLLRFKRFIANGCKHVTPMPLSSDDIMTAENSIFRFVQQNTFADTITLLKGDSCLKRVASPLRKLHPFLHEDLLRVGGRLSNSSFAFEVKHPVILPPCHVTTLLIRHAHSENGHVGAAHTWTLLRKLYWIVRGATEVRRVIGNCVQCKKRNTKLSQQIMADLPASRVTSDRPPFSATGLDFFGPMHVKQGRSAVQRYGCLFTCMATRAIHLEVAHELSSSSFINCLRRFICRRGCPSDMYSDNGTNFVGANKELQNAVKDSSESIGKFIRQKGVSWHFNSPSAPHAGGVWERMVRSVKTILKNLLKEQLVNDEVLHTLLLEVERILNSRPLIPVVMDPTADSPLTPNDLLLPYSDHSWAPGNFSSTDNYSRQKWRQAQYLSEQFWRRWRSEYLPMLQRRTKWTDKFPNIKIDDIVLVASDNIPRGKWPLAKVVETFPDKKGVVRKVRVKIGDKYLFRPIAKICDLKIE